MTDYRAMFEGIYLGSWDLVDADGNKREITLTIAKVEARDIVMEGGKKNKKPVITFSREGWLPMVCCKTVARTIAALYGNDTKSWIGKQITIYGTTTEVGGQTKDCIRVRPKIPEPPARQQGQLGGAHAAQ